MAQRQGATSDGSDIVYRILATLTNEDLPAADKAATLQRCAVELAPFTVGEGFRADYLGELSTQLRRTIAAYQQVPT